VSKARNALARISSFAALAPKAIPAAVATRRASRDAAGSAASSPARNRVLCAGFLALLALALLPAAASADTRIGGGGLGADASLVGPGGLGVPGALAVSKAEGGDIYVIDTAPYNQRVSQFKPDGTFVRAFGWGVVPGAASGTGDLANGTTSVTNVTTTSGSFAQGLNSAGRIITGPGIPPNTVITAVTSTGLELSNSATASATGAALTVVAGPGNVPTNEVQKLTVSATGGQFKLTFKSPDPGSTSDTTAPIPAAATHEQLQSALEALADIGAGNVSVSGGPGDAEGTSPYRIEFQGRYADVNVHPLSLTESTLSGGSPSSEATVTTPIEGGGALETCTTVCAGESFEIADPFSGRRSQESEPGQLDYSDEIAVDNNPSSGSYGDVYVVDQRNFRVEKYSPEGKLELIFGGGVDHTTGADVCTAADLAAGDACGAGLPGTGPSHFYKETPGTGPEGRSTNSWGHEGSNSIAVGPGGTVYVGDYGRIQEFEPSGAFAGEFVLPVKAGEEPQFVSSLALDSAGDIYERSVTYKDGLRGLEIKTQVPGIREWSPAHALLRTFDAGPEEAGSEPTHIALDEHGDLFASDKNSGAFTFRAFKPDATLYAEFTSDQAPKALGISVGDAAANLYASTEKAFPPNSPGCPIGCTERYIAVIPLPQPGPPVVEKQHVTAIEPTTATLSAVVNPKEFDTSYRFQYISEEKFKADGEAFGAGTEQTALTPLGRVERPDPVQAAISGLTPATVYHWRVLAESECEPVEHPGLICETKPEETFETLPPVSVRGFTTQTVGPELLTLKAELNPNGSATHYTIRYGTGAGYSCEPGNTCSAEGTLPAGNEFVKVESEGKEGVTFTGLKPNTTYRYQLVAENSYTSPGHPIEVDQAFTTELSQKEEREAEHCPNTNLREENSSLALSDCRAYEQVSPPFKAGYPVFEPQLAPSGNRVTFTSIGVFTGDTGKTFYDSHRTEAGWLTQATVGRPAGPDWQPVSGHGGFNAELDSWIFSLVPAIDSGEAEEAKRSNAYYIGSSDGSFAKATPTISLPAGEPSGAGPFDEIIAQSADFSHLFLGSSHPLLPTDPRPGTSTSGFDRIYEVTGAGGPAPAISLVAEVPLNLKPGINGTCTIDSVFGREANSSSADGSTLFYDAPVELSPGARCEDQFGSGPNRVALFARTAPDPAGPATTVQLNTNATPQCSSPSPCATAEIQGAHFYGASPDGTRAWFTTAQPLIDSDTDNTNDLYLAKLENGELKELVQVSAGEANPAHPTPGKGAGVNGGAEIVVNSADAKVVAFTATGVLTTHPNPTTGQSAVQGAPNLYVYDSQTRETKFVAHTGLGGESQFTPDGRYLLFRSAGRLTPDDTDNQTSLFRYDFQTGRLIRVSIGRRGNDGNGNDNAYGVFIPTALRRTHLDVAAGDITRSISADGSTVVFATTAPLVSRDTNSHRIEKGAPLPTGGTCREEGGCTFGEDVYEWEESGHGTCAEPGGCISLVSDGVDRHGTQGGALLSASGRDITFVSARGLVPADTDGVRDVYDARVEGGFPRPAEPAICKSNEICHGPVPPEPSPPTLGTETFVGPPNPKYCPKGFVKRHGHCVKVRKHHKRRRHHKRAARAANTNRGGHK
jgi:hypothetical protein